MPKKPLVLIVMDGFGLSSRGFGNAIQLAKKPNLDYFSMHDPCTALNASGNAVGLPKGVMGNSEVGHYTLGAGRIIWQDLERINQEIHRKSFFKNAVLKKACQHVKKNQSTLHLMGLLSDGGVHAQIEHVFALLELAKKEGIKEVVVHCFTDGRDMAPRSALGLVTKLENKMKQLKRGRIGSIIGRYYAMDRDNRWNREHKAYDALVNDKGFTYPSARKAIQAAYKREEGDEFIQPSRILGANQEKDYLIKERDAVIFFNFRNDRARELTRAFTVGKFKSFRRKKLLKLFFVCLCEYDKKLKLPVAFPPVIPKNSLGEVFSKRGYRQLRLAETEKYAHVTYFFNGGLEKPFKGEERVLIPSPKVTTYDQVPKMSAFKITNVAIKALESNKYEFILINFANCDMVGHTGKLKETIKAIEVVDRCIGQIAGKVLEKGGIILITADHGNAEQKIFKGKPSTSHTTNPVPCYLIGSKYKKLKKGGLSDVAPTILKVLGLKKPKEMKGKALI
ncbi:MAG: 2,3-bisphosphoglycerate-independent phosphoglycerate mutase [Nanoarchaeota archaeon]